VSAGRYGIEGYDETTYGDSFADVYDDWYATLADDDFPRYLASLLPDCNADVLELGVGTGRLLSQLRALRTHHDSLSGIDSSQAMLNKLTERNDLHDARITVGDFSQLLPDGPFDLIFVGYNTLFNLPDDDALVSCLSLVHDKLKDTGVFAIDVVVPEPTSTPEVVSVKSVTTESVTLSVSRHDHQSQRIVGQFVEISSASGVKMRPWSVRYWTPPQLDSLATAAGLSLRTRIADGNGRAHDNDDARHISTYVRT
jgi:trans-aconitate methyltransferase